jgi:hypothetical protein
LVLVVVHGTSGEWKKHENDVSEKGDLWDEILTLGEVEL